MLASKMKSITSIHPDTRSRMNSSDDFKLLQAIAVRQDRQAFAQLYERHARHAYNLARQLTDSREEAEDAVQDALLRVWRYAAAVRSDRNPRGWILKVVARAALMRARSRHKATVPEQDDIALLVGPRLEGASSESESERHELMNALRDEFQRLSAENRRLMALYFGAGFSQSEISETLGISQSAVSQKIEKVLGSMRARLTASGFSAAVARSASGHLFGRFPFRGASEKNFR